MPSEPNWLEAAREYAFELATEQLNRVELDLKAHPDAHPDYHRAISILDEVQSRVVPRSNLLFDELSEAWMDYASALAIEMYLYGARDGGRIYHAFITGELPRKEDAHNE